jgi:hypothetical protein
MPLSIKKEVFFSQTNARHKKQEKQVNRLDTKVRISMATALMLVDVTTPANHIQRFAQKQTRRIHLMKRLRLVAQVLYRK